jgi:hypothetical protein
MIIQLQRQWVAGDPAYIHPFGPTVCAVCALPFEEPTVVAWTQTDGDTEMGVTCLDCVEYLGQRNPERFPTIEEYRDLLEKYPEAMYPSAEAFERAAEEAGFEDPAHLVYEDSWVWRSREGASA